MISCIVIDDDPAYCELMAGLISKVDFLDLCGVFEESLEGFAFINSRRPDLLFLDIEMPRLNGIELLLSMNERERPKTIIVSSRNDYAHEAFDLEVADYLLKPVSFPRLLKSAQKAKKLLESPRQATNVFVKIDSQLKNLKVAEIYFIEAFGDYLKIHTDTKTLVVSTTMKKVLDILPNDAFVRVHRSYIVNIPRIDNIEQNNIQIGKTTIPISTRNRKDLMDRINAI